MADESEHTKDHDIEEEQRVEGEGACCECGGSCILLWVGLFLFHAGLLFVVLFYGKWTLTFFVLIAYAITVRVALWKVDTPWMVAILWIVFVFVIALAGGVLSNTMFPLYGGHGKPVYDEKTCEFDVCSQVNAKNSRFLQTWCKGKWPYHSFTLIGDGMYFKTKVAVSGAVMSHVDSKLRVVIVNGEELVMYGDYDAIDTLQQSLLVVSSRSGTSISALTLNFTSPDAVQGTGPQLSQGGQAYDLAVVDGLIYWVTGYNSKPLPNTTAYVSDGTTNGTMTAMAYYGIANPCLNAPAPTVYEGDIYERSVWAFWGLLLFSCFPYCLASLLIYLLEDVKAMIFCLYLGASYSLFVFLLACDVDFFDADNALFFISYFMIFVAFAVIVRFPQLRVHGGWVLLATTLCYYIFTPSFFLTLDPIPHFVRFFITLTILFVGLMVPSIPVILCASGGIITFVGWLIFFYLNLRMILSFVLLAIIGLSIIVGVVQLKNVLKGFRISFYEMCGPKTEEGGVNRSQYESYLEKELMRLTPRKVEIV